MAKLPVTILVFRFLQLALALAFVVFWIWLCVARFVVGGGAGELFFGYVISLLSIAVCVHGIWAFAKSHHLKEHSALYHNARWAIDLGVVCLWLGFILISILVPVPEADEDRSLFGPPSMNNNGEYPSASDPIMVVGMGVNTASLFSAITFFMTSLLLIIPAVRARRTVPKGSQSRTKGDAVEEETATDAGLQAPEAAHMPQQSGAEHSYGVTRIGGFSSVQGVQMPQAAYGRAV